MTHKTYVLNLTPGGNAIELGGGDHPLIRPNVDILPGPTVDIVHDLSVFPWPLQSDSFDDVISLYTIEHVEWKKTLEFIRELYRILKPGGKAVIITANTYEQCRYVLERKVDESTSEVLFGSQEFPAHGGVHKAAFSPRFAEKLFRKAGFGKVNIVPHPKNPLDMIIEARKVPMESLFERSYFEDGTTGYSMYRDFATHYDTARILQGVEPKIKSILDVGAGRGYVVRLLNNDGIPGTAMDISRHCMMTRATDHFVLHDALEFPWPFANNQFDLCFSINFLEHLKEEQVEPVFREMMRVSCRGLHGIHTTDPPFPELDKDHDPSHHCMHEMAWWDAKLKGITGGPGYPFALAHPRILEYARPAEQPPISLAPSSPDNLVKLNLGSFKEMFYYGWVNCDILDLTEFVKGQAYMYVPMDATKPFHWKDNEVDIIFSSHLLEHFSRQEGMEFLRECHRVMKPGGVIRISVPDGRLVTRQYVEGDIMEQRFINIGVERASDDAEAFYELLLANHKTVYDEAALRGMLSAAGFRNIGRATAFNSRSEAIRTQTMNTFPDLSLILEAEK